MLLEVGDILKTKQQRKEFLEEWLGFGLYILFWVGVFLSFLIAGIGLLPTLILLGCCAGIVIILGGGAYLIDKWVDAGED